MTVTVTIGKRLVPLESIALFEPVDPATLERMETERPFKTRVLMKDRDSVLTEEPLEALVTRHAFRMVMADGIATNPAVHFSVETFEPSTGFTPRKPYRSRLIWRDFDGELQSKLLLSDPEAVLAVAVRGVPADAEEEKAAPPKGSRRKRRPATPAPE